MEIRHLRQFCTIVESGTLLKAAEGLYTSQPALSRSLKQLEEELGVALFTRSKNRMQLNENGKLAYELAKKLLAELDDFGVRLRALDKSSKTIAVASCAPMPMMQLASALTGAFPDKIISTQLAERESLLAGLLRGDHQIVIVNERMQHPEAVFERYCEERLLLCVPKEHPLAQRKEGIYLHEVGNATMLLYTQIGFWKSIPIEQMPKTQFILQNDYDNFCALVRESNLLSFASDLSVARRGIPKGKVVVPILDEAATQCFYVGTLKRDRQKYRLQSLVMGGAQIGAK